MEHVRINAQFEGTIVRIAVVQGQLLRTNDDIVQIALKSTEGIRKAVLPVRAFRHCTIEEICVHAGQHISNGTPLVVLSYCTHPTSFKDLCVLCGEPVNGENGHLEHSVVIAGGQSLAMTSSEVHTMDKRQHDALKTQRQLALIVDLDHTILHATGQPRLSDLEQQKERIRIIDIEEGGRMGKYFIKLRPYLEEFLSKLSRLFRITIYTHGTRPYAEAVAKLLDPKRIVSRTDTPNLATSKSLRKIFPSDPSMALILDDRDDVWEGPQSVHLMMVRPYVYFRNAPEVNNSSGANSMQNKIAPKTDPRHTSLTESEAEAETTATNAIEEDAAVDETDGYLLHIEALLTYVHSEYYRRLEAADSSQLADASQILQECYKATLKGVRLMFSGLIALNCENQQTHRLYQLADKLGAVVVASLDEATHVVAVSTETNKAHQAIAAGDIFLVHVDWLLHCQWRLQRVDERGFLLAQLSKEPKLPFVPSAAASSSNVEHNNTSIEPLATTTAAVEESKAEVTETAAASKPNARKRLKLQKLRVKSSAAESSSATITAAPLPSEASTAASNSNNNNAAVYDIYLHPDGQYTRTPELPVIEEAAKDTILLQEEYEEAERIQKEIERMAQKQKQKQNDVAVSLLDIPEEPVHHENPEEFPEDRVRRRSIDYTNDRITANDFEYSEWPAELTEYYESVGKGAGGHIDDHEPQTEPPMEDENDYQDELDNNYADQYDEGYTIAERTAAPTKASESLEYEGIQIKTPRGSTRSNKRDRNFPDVPRETAKRTKHVATESSEASDEAETDDWINQMEEEIHAAEPP